MVTAAVLGESILFLFSVLKRYRMVREACPWQGCMFSASKASQVNDCSRLQKISRRIYARENMERVLSLTLFSGIYFLGYWEG